METRQMTITVPQSENPGVVTIRVYVTGDRSFDYLERQMTPWEAIQIVADISEAAARAISWLQQEDRRKAKPRRRAVEP